MEKAAEQGSAIAAAVEGVERQFGSNSSGTYASCHCLSALNTTSIRKLFYRYSDEEVNFGVISGKL